MELVNEFTVNVPVDEAWAGRSPTSSASLPACPARSSRRSRATSTAASSRSRSAPSPPSTRAQATFVEKDDAAHKAVLKAEGRDTARQGQRVGDSSPPSSSPQGDGQSPRSRSSTDLTITGKVAQFGRGALADVSTKLLGQFVDCLETTVLGPVGAPRPTRRRRADGRSGGRRRRHAPARPRRGAAASRRAGHARRRRPCARWRSPKPQPIDLLDAAGAPLAKRLIPVGVVPS